MSVDSRRRQFLVAGSTSLLCALSSPVWASVPAALVQTGTRQLSFNNLHTGERLSIGYWSNGSYDSDALGTINHFLRDWRDGSVHMIDPKLLDLLHAINARLDTNEPFDVICGYRSPQTNAMLHAESSGVAVKSLHMQGMAIDIRVPGRSLVGLHTTAVSLRAGGVGYYPGPDFVHVDTGRVRYWAEQAPAAA